jgi:hypothetical protein
VTPEALPEVTPGVGDERVAALAGVEVELGTGNGRTLGDSAVAGDVIPGGLGRFLGRVTGGMIESDTVRSSTHYAIQNKDLLVAHNEISMKKYLA